LNSFTGGTYSSGTLSLNTISGGTYTVTGFYTGQTSYVNSLTTGIGLSANTTTGNITIQNTSPDQTVVLNNGTGISVTGTYPNFTISSTGSTSGDYLPLSGGTVTGATNFTGGLTATTISAATYLNLTTGDLPSVQARRTTGFNLPATINFITLDTTDVENDSTVVSHDNTNTERIYVYSTGLYLIHYHGDVGPGAVSDFEFSVYKNALTLVNGSLISGKNSSTDKVTAGVDIIVSLNSGDYVSLYGRYIGSSGGIANNVVFSVIKLEGVVGPQGPTGAQGPQGIGLFTGGTITGNTNFTGGLSANTFVVTSTSATTLTFTTTPTNNNANTQILTRNSTTGDVEYRDSSSLGGGSIDTGKVIALTQIMYF